MKNSFCIDLQRFMRIPTKFPLSRNQLGFLHAPRSKDGTDNHSRRTDGIMRSADLPTAPFFRELRADKERSKETPMKNISLLLTVS